MDKIRFFLQQSWLLISASLVFGVLLAALNAQWEPRIKANEIAKFNRRALALVPEASTFETIDSEIIVDLGKGQKTHVEVKKALDAGGELIGWAFAVEGSGFADKIRLVLAADAKFEKLRGYDVLFSNETPGFGDKIKNDFFKNQFHGAPVKAYILNKIGDAKTIDDQIVAISGATVSSEAVVKTINTFLRQVQEALRKQGQIGNGQ
ncbi:MAG: FMN-binding protein [Sedimentisphaerales bacterium]|nr:FMN-binding protein [Sedimentisphaerales bacterium]